MTLDYALPFLLSRVSSTLYLLSAGVRWDGGGQFLSEGRRNGWRFSDDYCIYVMCWPYGGGTCAYPE